MRGDTAKMGEDFNSDQTQTDRRVAPDKLAKYGRLIAMALCVLAVALAVADWLVPSHPPGIEWLALGMAIVGAILGGVATFWRIA